MHNLFTVKFWSFLITENNSLQSTKLDYTSIGIYSIRGFSRQNVVELSLYDIPAMSGMCLSFKFRTGWHIKMIYLEIYNTSKQDFFCIRAQNWNISCWVKILNFQCQKWLSRVISYWANVTTGRNLNYLYLCWIAPSDPLRLHAMISSPRVKTSSKDKNRLETKIVAWIDVEISSSNLHSPSDVELSLFEVIFLTISNNSEVLSMKENK